MKTKINAWYGWRPDLPDHRDLIFKVAKRVKLPESVDLRAGLPAVYDQGQLGSCTANGIAGALEFAERKQSETRAATPSRLFIYYNERVMEGSVGEDAGAMIRDGIKSVNDKGAPPETTWPYIINKFAVKPSAKAYRQGMKRQSLTYQRIQNTNIDDQRASLASGFPYVFGFTVYDYFESDAMNKTGILRVPTPDEGVLGGHAVLAVGYDDTKKLILARNSWGADWVPSMQGHFWMPYEYITNPNLADDFWNITLVE